MKICLQNVWYVFHKISYKYLVAPKLHIDIDDNQGVKKGEGEMVEGSQEVKVVVILKIGFFNIYLEISKTIESMKWKCVSCFLEYIAPYDA